MFIGEEQILILDTTELTCGTVITKKWIQHLRPKQNSANQNRGRRWTGERLAYIEQNLDRIGKKRS